MYTYFKIQTITILVLNLFPYLNLDKNKLTNIIANPFKDCKTESRDKNCNIKMF